MLKKVVVLFAIYVLVAISTTTMAADYLTVGNAVVTGVKVYATADDSVQVWLQLNGSGRVGPNPANGSNTCELWTQDKAVHATALAALMAGKKVTVRYADRGEGTYWCNVVDFAITAN